LKQPREKTLKSAPAIGGLLLWKDLEEGLEGKSMVAVVRGSKCLAGRGIMLIAFSLTSTVGFCPWRPDQTNQLRAEIERAE